MVVAAGKMKLTSEQTVLGTELRNNRNVGFVRGKDSFVGFRR